MIKTEQDYKNLPAGTIVLASNEFFPWTKCHDNEWRNGPAVWNPQSNKQMAERERHLLVPQRWSKEAINE